MMCLEPLFNQLNRQVAKLKQKYVDFSNGIVQAIIEEELKIRREELDARPARQKREQSPEA
ncbi:MAG TPA: hypothetical protein VNV41_13165 [Candidatus Acidoferrales bacterium]|jgi:hypothetical protein|nr:hypothetical protein [Candidatus Acidoferrales bacterium]